MKKLSVIMTSAFCASLMAVNVSAASNDCVSVFDKIENISGIVNSVNISQCDPQALLRQLLENCLNGQFPSMPELPEQFSRTLNMICQACMTKETWNRPTAQQLADFATKYMENDNPKITWKIAEDIVVPEEYINNVANQSNADDEKQPETKAENNMGKTVQMSSLDMKKTMVRAADVVMEQAAVAGDAPQDAPDIQPAAEAKFALKSEQKSKPLAIWVWFVVAFVGLLLGAALNYIS